MRYAFLCVTHIKIFENLLTLEKALSTMILSLYLYYIYIFFFAEKAPQVLSHQVSVPRPT